MSQERDTSKTGASTGPSTGFIKIGNRDHNMAKFLLGDKEIGDTIAFYLDNVSLEWRDAVAEHSIPAHWNINLNIYGDFGEGGKTYVLPISSHWKNPVLATVVNAIAGAIDQTPEWKNANTRIMRIVLRERKPVGKKAYVSAMVFRSDAKGDFLPVKYPFNEAKNGFDGVPSDMEEANAFWLGLANDLRKMTGGLVINAQKATLPLPPGVLPEPTTTAPPAATPPPATTPKPTPPNQDMTAEVFWDKAKVYLAGDNADTLLSGLKSTIKGFTTYQPAGVTTESIVRKFNGRLGILNIKGQFSLDATGKEYRFEPVDDDLPF